MMQTNLQQLSVRTIILLCSVYQQSCALSIVENGSTLWNCHNDCVSKNCSRYCYQTTDESCMLEDPVIDCGWLPNPINGFISLSSGTRYPATTSYNCSSGYALQGNTSRTCQTSGNWSGTTPSCLGLDCGPLTAPTNGQVFPTGTRYPSSATYICLSGYTLQGSAMTSCEMSGSWSFSVPACLGCTLPWVAIGQRCLQVVKVGSGASWSSMVAGCQSIGSTPARVENSEASTIGPDITRLGCAPDIATVGGYLNRTTNPPTWQWYDGSVAAKIAWSPGEPEGNPAEDYLALYGSRKKFVDATDPQLGSLSCFICQKPMA